MVLVDKANRDGACGTSAFSIISMDADGGCRRQVIRLLKTIRDKSPELKAISSYHIKNAVLNMARKIADKVYWSQTNLDKCFLDCLKQLRENVQNKDLHHFLQPGLNLLAELTEHNRDRTLTGLAEENVLDIVYYPQGTISLRVMVLEP